LSITPGLVDEELVTLPAIQVASFERADHLTALRVAGTSQRRHGH
jgi:hypothetical protein